MNIQKIVPQIEVTRGTDHKNLFSVVILADRPARHNTWVILHNTLFNPYIVKVEDQGPTGIVLFPNKGYNETDIVAQMAYAAMCFAQTDNLLETLLENRRNYFAVEQPREFFQRPKIKNFLLDPGTLILLQDVYLGSLLVDRLTSRKQELEKVGPDFGYVWECLKEAREALRRLKFYSPRDELEYKRVEYLVGGMERLYLSIQQVSLDKNKTLESIKFDIDVLERYVQEFGASDNAVSLFRDASKKIGKAIEEFDIEAKNRFKQPILNISETMDEIRAKTPPAPGR